MIRRFVSVVFLLALGGALTYFGLRYHYVYTEEQILVVEKTEMSFTDTYADVREWSVTEFRNHPKLVHALMKGGHAEVIPAQLTDKLREALDSLFRNEPPNSKTDTSRR